VAVGPDAAVPRPEGVEVIELRGVLLPGLVNTHTHLELTGLAGQISDAAFFDWIQHIRRAKSATSQDAFLDAARTGVQDMWAHGITTVADTGDTGVAATALRELGGRGLVYQEVFGPHPDQLEESFRGLVAAVTQLDPVAGGNVRIGVSPHAPYTVSEALFRRVAAFARSEGLPLAVHLAESREETAFVTAGEGPFADLWLRRGIPLPRLGSSPVDYLDDCGVLGPDTLVIHAVQTDDLDRRRLRDAGSAVALCPRSNHRHGHGVPPVAACLSAGIRAGLGTDSLASVESPDLLAEGRAVRQLADMDPVSIVRMLTLGGAAAIGLDAEIGSLEPGKWADLLHLNVPIRPRLRPGEPPPPLDTARIALRCLDATAEEVGGTWVAGRRVFSQDEDGDSFGRHRRPLG
jgi:cytosine/adenosine deaminase-related metal-dependent hydrolase